MIDGVDIATVTLEELRSKITVIAQDSDLIQGTLRKNLDPFSEFNDVEVERAISKSGLTQLLMNSDRGSCTCYGEIGAPAAAVDD